MTRILVVEANPLAVRQRAAALRIPAGAELYTRAIAAIAPQISCDIIYAADTDRPLAAGTSLADYAGLVIGGSALHAYSSEPEVLRQLQFLHAVGEVGLPILGSCWGLQLAALAAGGEVRNNPRGREIGLARKIVPTEAGRAHPLLAGRSDSYDALCIHYDEVSRLPPGAVVLASNSHSAVQVAAFTLGRSSVWAVEYHPEFDLPQLAALFKLYRDDLVAQGFASGPPQLDHYIAAWDALAANPANEGLAWQLGIDNDVLNDQVRRTEIANWLQQFAR